jgi:hypothetical protein
MKPQDTEAGPVRRMLRVLFKPVWMLLALLLLFEEWLWDNLKRIVAAAARWLSQWRAWVAFEAWLSQLSPRAALIALLVPWLLLLPLKFVIVALASKGRVLAALGMTFLTKLLGTAFVTRIFTLTKPALMQVPWFARFYTRITDWLARAHAWVNAIPAVAEVRARWRQWRHTRP